MCLVCFELETYPFLAKYKVLMLSCNMTLDEILYPWASKNWCVQSISLDLSCRAIISLPDQLLEGIFCLVDEPVIAPLPNVRWEPVWPLQLSCVWWDVSTYQWMLVRDSAERVRQREQVELRYFRTCFNLPQLSLLGCFTRVVRKGTIVWISYLTQDRKSNCAVVW